MTLLNITVFVGTARLNLATFETIVTGQASIAVGKNLWVADLVDGTTEVICPVVFRNPAELPQGILKPGAESSGR